MHQSNIKIAKRTLNILKNKPWDRIKLAEILKDINLKHTSIKNKIDLLKNINRYVDYLLNKESVSIEKSSEKDMLFEVIMMRFDILQKNRKSFIMLYKSFKTKPQKSLILIPSFLDSMILTLSFVGIEKKGLKGSLFIKSIFIIYVLTFFTWINDESNSLEKTMTNLDKLLEQSKLIINLVK